MGTTLAEDQMLAHQLQLEKLYSKNQTIKRVKSEFLNCKEIDFHKRMVDNNIDPDFGYDLLTQMALHKRTTLPIMVAILRHHFEVLGNPSQITTDQIYKAVMCDLLDWSPLNNQLIVRYGISQDVQEDLDRYQYPLPMVVEPKQVTDNRDTGYLLTRNSIILRKNHHEDDVCLDHINRMNRVRFVINQDTALMVKNQWKNLDKPKEGESKEDYQKRVKAFEKYDNTAKEVISTLCKHSDTFYLTHKYDKRGRVYCQGYHVNYQGAPWNKAVIELADKEIVP